MKENRGRNNLALGGRRDVETSLDRISHFNDDITNATPQFYDTPVDLLITVESDEIGYQGLLPGVPICAYFTCQADVSVVSPCLDPGWVKTWGYEGDDVGHGVASDDEGNVYITGFINTATGRDILLRKYNTAGVLEWDYEWGGNGDDEGYFISIDKSGNVCMTGFFEDTVDFNPGSGVNERTASSRDAYLVKFNSNGDFQWVATWWAKYGL